MSAYILDVAVEPGPSKRHCGSHVAHRVGCRVHAFRTLSLYRTKSRSRLRTKHAGDAYPRTHLLFTVQKTRVCYLVFSMAASSMRAFASTHAVGSRVASGGLTGRARTHGASPKLVVVHKRTRRGRGNFSTVRASVKADDVPEPVAMEAAAVTSAPPRCRHRGRPVHPERRVRRDREHRATWQQLKRASGAARGVERDERGFGVRFRSDGEETGGC